MYLMELARDGMNLHVVLTHFDLQAERKLEHEHVGCFSRPRVWGVSSWKAIAIYEIIRNLLLFALPSHGKHLSAPQLSGDFALFNGCGRRQPHRMSFPSLTTEHHGLASDNTAGLTPEALAAVVAVNAGSHPSYGTDAVTERAKQLICELLDTDCAVFFVGSGTVANALALAHVCPSYRAILCHEVAHADTDECGAPEFFSGGSKVLTIRGENGKLSPIEVERVIAQRENLHYSKAGVLSLTQATEWGTLYTPAEVQKLSEVAKQHGLSLHMDGARFANAAAALATHGYSAADFTWRAGVEVLSLGGTKSGMMATEAVVFFDRERARDFDFRIKQAGQLTSKQRFASAQWVAMLQDGAWLRHASHANAMAQQLASGLRALGLRILVEPASNSVFVELASVTAEQMSARGWHFYRFIGESGYRLMTSWATEPALLSQFLTELGAVLSETT